MSIIEFVFVTFLLNTKQYNHIYLQELQLCLQMLEDSVGDVNHNITTKASVNKWLVKWNRFKQKPLLLESTDKLKHFANAV